MTGIYLSPKGKEEIEAKIAELDKEWKGKVGYNMTLQHIDILKEILSSAKTLPIKDDWESIAISSRDMSLENVLVSNYPTGVIIQPKNP